MTNRQSGFTLLELLIAMTLMGLILVMLYGGLRVGIRSWEGGEERAETVNQIRLVQELIRRQFRQSVTTYRNDENEGRVIAFHGEPERVSLVTPMLAHLGLGGLYYVQIDMVENNDIGKLRLRWQPFRADVAQDNEETEDAGMGETVLLNGVSEVQWAYFDPPESVEGPEWHDQWENVSESPLLVRLRLKLQGKPWPDLVIMLAN